MDLMIQGSNPGGGRFSVLQKVKLIFGAYPASSSVGTRCSFPGKKQSKQEVDLSTPSTAKAKNVHTVPPLILYAFMALKRTALPSYVLPQ
jgi:hypothetical protein